MERLRRTGGVRVGSLGATERCRRCGGENVNWCAPSPLWNLVMRGDDINGDSLFHDLVCPRSFMVLAEEAGVSGQWRVAVDPEPAGLIETTPSGRTWNPKTWMWDEEVAQ